MKLSEGKCTSDVFLVVSRWKLDTEMSFCPCTLCALEGAFQQHFQPESQECHKLRHTSSGALMCRNLGAASVTMGDTGPFAVRQESCAFGETTSSESTPQL